MLRSGRAATVSRGRKRERENVRLKKLLAKGIGFEIMREINTREWGSSQKPGRNGAMSWSIHAARVLALSAPTTAVRSVLKPRSSSKRGRRHYNKVRPHSS